MEVIVLKLLLVLGCITAVTGRGNCSSYCSYDGEYQKGFACMDPPNVYCCGNLNLRYCCDDRDGDVSEDYKPVSHCKPDESSTLRILLGVMGSVILLFLLCACTWQVCALVCSKDPQNRRVGHYDDDLPSISSTVDLRREDTRSQVFDPSAPYAFNPPPYEKDPPKYEELFGVTGQGSSNNDVSEENPQPSPSGSAALVNADPPSVNDYEQESESSSDTESLFSMTNEEVRSRRISSTSSRSATEEQNSVHMSQRSTESSSDFSSHSEENISISSHVSSSISSLTNSNTGTEATDFDTASPETRNAEECHSTDIPSYDNNSLTSGLPNCDI